jgi:hypothetical protein
MCTRNVSPAIRAPEFRSGWSRCALYVPFRLAYRLWKGNHAASFVCTSPSHFNEIPIILRRKKVLELLDNMVESTGPAYESHGPLVSSQQSGLPTFTKPHDDRERSVLLKNPSHRHSAISVWLPFILIAFVEANPSSFYPFVVSVLASDFISVWLPSILIALYLIN